MSNIVIDQFIGIFPRTGARLISEAAGTVAEDIEPLSGYLVGRPDKVDMSHTVGAGIVRVYRINDTDGDTYLEFDNQNVDVVKGPLINDAFERYYWAGGDIPPRWNTLARIKAGDPEYKLGYPEVPGANRPTLATDGLGSGPLEDRFYVITFIDPYGHESPPSRPRRIRDVMEGDTITVTWAAEPVLEPNYPNVDKVRIYRTVPGRSATAFFLVAEVDPGTSPYLDNEDSDDVAANDILASEEWFIPPVSIRGFEVMPNGFIAGYSGRDIYFSEPYRPHAWPRRYVVSVEDDIVGIKVFGTSLAILTEGTPYVASGVTPDSVSLTKVGASNACLSKRSIVGVANAVLFASEEGIVQIDASGQTVITKDLLTREQWLASYFPSEIVAARDGENTYVAYYRDLNTGFQFDITDIDRGLVTVTSDGNVQGLDQDYEGRRALLIQDSQVYQFNASTTDRLPYVWQSKEFYMVRPVNLGAIQLNADPTVPLPPLPDANSVQMTMWVDGEQVFSTGVPFFDKPFSAPSGYKGQVFQFRFAGDVPLSRFMIAETQDELSTI